MNNQQIYYQQPSNKSLPTWAIVLICVGAVLFLGIVSVLLDSDDPEEKEEVFTGNATSEQSKLKEPIEVYSDDNFKVKITNYEPDDFDGEIYLNIYIENNSDSEVTFKIENPIINSFSVDGYFIESIDGKTKKNVKHRIYDLDENGIKPSKVDSITFTLSIFKSDSINNYLEDKKITVNINKEK